LFSDDPHVFKYEKDLAEDIAKDLREIRSIAVGNIPEVHLPNSNKILIETTHNNPLQAVPITIVGQLLGLYKSLNMGLDPDNPSVSGAINRVVQGVVIYKRQ
ncbi:hypothetical protein MKP05_21600, partial [Halomonas sp. EGI 63088]